jgi:hypothetical protein
MPPRISPQDVLCCALLGHRPAYLDTRAYILSSSSMKWRVKLSAMGGGSNDAFLGTATAAGHVRRGLLSVVCCIAAKSLPC